MAEPKKQDLIEQYQELVKKRHALEAKKQFAVTMGAVDVIPGSRAVKGAYETRKALGAAEEVAGAARAGEEAAGLAAREAEDALSWERLTARIPESELEAASGRSAQSGYWVESYPPQIEAAKNPRIPDPSADYYRLLMDQASGAYPKGTPWPVSVQGQLFDPSDVNSAALFFRKDFIPYAKAKAKSRFLKEAQEQFRAKIASEFGGLSPAEVDDVIKTEGMNPAFLRAEGPSADWIKSMEKQTGISWDELVEREGGRPDLRVLTEEADSELRSAAQVFEQRQEEYADLLLAREQPLAEADTEKINNIRDLIERRDWAMVEMEDIKSGFKHHYSDEGMVPVGTAEAKAKEINELTRQLDELLAELPAERTMTAPAAMPYGSLHAYSPSIISKGQGTVSGRHSRRKPHGFEFNQYTALKKGGERAAQKASLYKRPERALRDLQRETHERHWSNLSDEAKKRQAYEAAQEGISSKKQAYETARAERVAARTKSFTAGMSAEDIAKQYAMARAKAGAMFTPVVGAAVEWREADAELAKVNAQLKALTEGASPKDRVRLEDYLMSEGSPAPEEDDLKWGEPTEEPPE